MNNIPAKQNSPEQLERIKATSFLYAKTEALLYCQIIFSVPVVVLLSILVAIWPEYKLLSATYGIVIVLVDIVLVTPYIKRLKEQAVKIQEIFDCDVLELEWKSLRAGDRPQTEDIHDAASNYDPEKFKWQTIEDWYPRKAGEVPMFVARIICQRSNCKWESNLRKRYSIWIISFLLTVVTLVLIIGLIGEISLNQIILAVASPLLPVAILCVRQYFENEEARIRAERLVNYSQHIWEELLLDKLEPQTAEVESRDIQSEIYIHRLNSPRIFNWIYKKLRDKQEELMNVGAEDLVEKWKEKHPALS